MLPRLEVSYKKDCSWPKESVEPIRSFLDLRPYLRHLPLLDREAVIAIHLDALNRPLAKETISLGTLTEAVLSPREVFKGAFLANSAGIILVHNHPSGNPKPSERDIATTKRLAKAGELLGIPLVDHLIFAEGGLVSLCTAN